MFHPLEWVKWAVEKMIKNVCFTSSWGYDSGWLLFFKWMWDLDYYRGRQQKPTFQWIGCLLTNPDKFRPYVSICVYYYIYIYRVYTCIGPELLHFVPFLRRFGQVRPWILSSPLRRWHNRSLHLSLDSISEEKLQDVMNISKQRMPMHMNVYN